MKKFIWIFFIFIVVVSFLITTMFGARKGSVQISNQSDQVFLGGTLEVCGQKFTIDPLKPNGVQIIYFKVKSDSHYDIAVQFKAGTLKKSLGYVTNGMNFDDELIVSDTDISLEDRRKEFSK
jgi:hypothetical protein